MRINPNRQNIIRSRFIDFFALGCTFYASCLLLSVPLSGETLFYTLVYATVILISVRLGRYLLSTVFTSMNIVARKMLCNAAGLLVGGIAMFELGSMVLKLNEMAVVVVFSSVMAFFVLGTISPLLHKSAFSSKSRHITH